MGKKLGLALLVLFFLVLISQVVYAQQPAPKQDKDSSGQVHQSYLVLKAGIFYPQGDVDNLDTGFSGEFAYGYRFHENWAFEIGSGYFGADGRQDGVLGGLAASEKDEMYAIPLTVAIKGILPLDDQFEIYGLAGGGGYYVHAESTL
ncbi:MAG TPA: outer membrane beta-barrel protein, partial [Syntrophorhabdaceae bacterium]|nr:outer membrane beta-barrel protein [Syntrophorhabdaceae bacterium]